VIALGLAENQSTLQKSSLPEDIQAGFIPGYLEVRHRRFGVYRRSSRRQYSGLAAPVGQRSSAVERVFEGFPLAQSG